MQTKFSIILPTYNRAYVLWKAIQSILNQTEPSWQLIVVNDGSTDCTLRLIEEFNDPRITAVTIDNHGPSYARNRGLDLADSPFVAYLDSDNTWHPNFLETMNQTIDDHPNNVLWCCGQHSTFWERTAKGEWRKIEEIPEPRQPITKDRIWNLKGSDTNCLIHRRHVADTIGGWDEDCTWLEDWDFCLRTFIHYPNQIKTIPDILVDYRQVHGTGADGLCAEAREDKTKEIEARKYLFNKWSSHPDFKAHNKLTRSIDTLHLQRAQNKARIA